MSHNPLRQPQDACLARPERIARRPQLNDAEARIARVEALADSWGDMLRTESEIMTTPQRNAWRHALAELRHALTVPTQPENEQ